MTTRVERKERAQQKREDYIQRIVAFMRTELEAAYKRFKDPKRAFEQALYSGDIKLNSLLKECPQDAHLIRSAGYQLKARLEKSLELK